MTFADELRALNACREAVLWVGDRTLEQAWRECGRSDWMLWLLRALGIDARECAGHFALRVWHLVPAESQLACAWAIDCATRGADDEETAAAAAAYASDAAAAAAAAAYAAAARAAAYAAAHAAHAARDARDADAASAAEQRDRFAAMVNAKFAAIGENDA